MKTAISIPDDVFERVEQRATALNLNRSQFFVRAAERYLLALDEESVTGQIDAAVLRGSVNVDATNFAINGLAQLDALTADDSW
jgi:hypothetical protein